MSMPGVSLLEEIVMARQIFRPDWVLNELHKGVRHALKQEQTGNLFGMDIQVISLYYLFGDKRPFYIQFAGANNPLYYIYNDRLTEIKADKQAVGGSLHRDEQARIFSLHGFAVPAETLMLYLFSDGYADQFGGLNKRKYMTKNFQQFLLRIHRMPVAAQQQQLDEMIINWMKEGQTKQMDDITILGIQL